MERLRKFLSIPPGLSRRYRDDVTVTVLWYEPLGENYKGGVTREGDGGEAVKAKL